MEIKVEFNFAAAHRLPYYNGPCNRMHGHSYKLLVTIAGEPDPRSGVVADFEEIKKLVNERVISKCDGHTMNDFLDNPTAEKMIVWMWNELSICLPTITEVTLFETPEYSVTYRGR